MGFKLNIFQNSKLVQIVTQNASVKWLPESGYISNPFSKAILEIDSRKLLPKVAAESCSQSCVLKLFHKGAPHSNRSKLPCEAAPQSCSGPKLLRTAAKPAPESCSKQLFVNVAAKLQSYSPQLLFKVATESHVPKKVPKTPKLRFCKPVHQNGSPKPFSRSCFPKLFPKAVSQSTSAKRLPLYFKPVPQSYSAKRLPKAAPQSCCRKLLPKVAF